MAVMMPTKAMIPKAMIATVMPVRSLFARTVRHDKEKISANFMMRRYEFLHSHSLTERQSR
jgi:hypothetical protein